MMALILCLVLAPPAPDGAAGLRPAALLPGLRVELVLLDQPVNRLLRDNREALTTIQRELERLRKAQRADVARLRAGRPEDEAALRMPEVARLRAMAQDHAFSEAYQSFIQDTTILVKQYAQTRDDDRDREWRMAAFQAESVGMALRSAPDLSMLTVHLKSDPAKVLGPFLREFQPVLGHMRTAMLEHLERVDAAERAAKAATGSRVVPVAARALRVKDFQVLQSIYVTVSWLYFRLTY